MTLKELQTKLIDKSAGSHYTYLINFPFFGNVKYDIREYNNNRGWCLNTYKESKYFDGWELVDSYGHDGLLLKECKQMILGECYEMKKLLKNV